VPRRPAERLVITFAVGPMLAVLYDIHGNLPALEAVLDDAQAQGATQYALGGDYAGNGLWPVETIRRLRTLETVAMIRGNHERWLLDRSDVPSWPALHESIEAQAAAHGPEAVLRLHGLPATAVVDDLMFCHGTPRSDVIEIAAERHPDDNEQLQGAHPRLFCGHSHIQFRRDSHDGRIRIVNPGSVGLPTDGDPRPAYALVADNGDVKLRRVDYDHAAYRRSLANHGAEWAREVAAAMEHGRT
jgi:diadenosine tetraphosphatase ApaH/serine/threonine PP2A family protein phosphatase